MYSDDVDLEAQIPYTDSPEFDRLGEEVASSLFEINSNIVALDKILKSMDNKNARLDHTKEERAVQLAEETRQKFKGISEPLRSLQSWPESLPSQKFTQQKMSREFSTALAEFQDIQKDLAQKQRSSIIASKSNIAQEELEGTSNLHDGLSESQTALLQEQEQEQQVNQNDINYQRELIQEREMEIQGIEQGIEELNEIFTDLSTIVAEQGTIIGKYETQVEGTTTLPSFKPSQKSP